MNILLQMKCWGFFKFFFQGKASCPSLVEKLIVSMIFNGFDMEEVGEQQMLAEGEQRQQGQNLKINSSNYLNLVKKLCKCSVISLQCENSQLLHFQKENKNFESSFQRKVLTNGIVFISHLCQIVNTECRSTDS